MFAASSMVNPGLSSTYFYMFLKSLLCISSSLVVAYLFCVYLSNSDFNKNDQPVREAVSYRGLFTAGWFGVREKHCFRLEIYDCLRASEHADPAVVVTTAPYPGPNSNMILGIIL